MRDCVCVCAGFVTTMTSDLRGNGEEKQELRKEIISGKDMCTESTWRNIGKRKSEEANFDSKT